MKTRFPLLLSLGVAAAAHAADPGGFLLATFRGEATPMTEQVYFLVSEDGREWEALNQAEPVLVSTLGRMGVRDPHILRAHDHTGFYLIATDLSIHRRPNWDRAQTAGSRSIVVWESEDLVNWSEPRLVEVAPDNAGCAWAPEAIYDEAEGAYLVFWASRTADDDYGKQRIWAAHTRDFRTFDEPFVYIDEPSAVIDATIVRDDGVYYRFAKNEDRSTITMETSTGLRGEWEDVDGFTLGRLSGYEGPSCFLLEPAAADRGARWCLILDWYRRGRGYRAYETDDLGSGAFEEAARMEFPFRPVRHGTVMPIDGEELARLRKAWGTLELESTSDQVKTINVVVDRAAGTVELPVKPGVDLARLDPGFEAGGGMAVTPAGPQDFSQGPVAYRVGDEHTLQVTAVERHNPALAGYYADPDIIYSHKTGRFHIYPTSDGFDGWSGTFFKTFSSADLVHWKDEGVILDLERDVDWANRNAWAPCIIEKKVGDAYRYFYYFTAAQKIGVAVADDPAGPFRDSGKALVDFRPEGVRGGQEIDPDVFHDPVSGKDFIYWGNGYMAVAELGEDMTSIRESTIQVMTPDRTFREGAHVFLRKGVYYFLWSEDDTRSPNYRVRYATAEAPTGPLTLPEDNLVIAKDESVGIYGTGHNSTIQVPGKDEWYIVYHRFNYPRGITMGGSAGFHREVCIDRMEFDAEGRIIRVAPTHGGIDPVD